MRTWINVLLIAASLFVGTSCSHDDHDPDPEPEPAQDSKTLLMYFPWSGDNHPLTTYFWTNIEDMQEAYRQYGKANEHVIVFICTSATDAVMFDIADYTDNSATSLAKHTQISSPKYTSANGIAYILSEMMAMAPAESYAITVGCHGMGWLPVVNSSGAKGAKGTADFKPHWEWDNADGLVTRYFGGSTADYQTDIATFASAIELTNTKMEYILFDDCYMSSIEAAYDLRDVADYLIACPTEVMGLGMPYATMGRYLLGTADYENVCQSFYDFYSTYSTPYGTIGVTKLNELDSLASIAKEINAQYSFDKSQLSDLQRMDGYTPIIFYDYGDYVAHLCSDSALLRRFNAQLEKTVPYKAHTTRYYSSISSSRYTIDEYSGITTSEPSVSPRASEVVNTSWYKATH